MDQFMRKLFIGENLEKIPDHLGADEFGLEKTFRFGFPELPTCIAADTQQGLIAIGNFHGMVKILGKPGMECHFYHPDNPEVLKMAFISTKAQLLTLCSNSVIYLWECPEREEKGQSESKLPHIIGQLEFASAQNSKPTCFSVQYNSCWAFIGSAGGDVYILNLNTMQLAGYTIPWNKMCGGFRQGYVVDILTNPWDEDKVLIGLADGLVALWSLQKGIVQKYQIDKRLSSLCWGDLGKLFYAGYTDGTMCAWNLKTTSKPDAMYKPCLNGLKAPKKQSTTPCKEIKRIQWIKRKEGVPLIITAGGGVYHDDKPLARQIGIFNTKSGGSHFTLDSPIKDFVIIDQSPYLDEPQDPHALVVLCEKELLAFDLTDKRHSQLTIAHTLDFHYTNITTISVFSNVSDDILSTITSLKSKQEVKEKINKQPLKLNGGKWGEHGNKRYGADIVVTGHSDGSIRTWNLVGAMFQPGLTIKSENVFKRLDIKEEQTPLTRRLISEYCIIEDDEIPPKEGEARVSSPTSEGSKAEKQMPKSETANSKADKPLSKEGRPVSREKASSPSKDSNSSDNHTSDTDGAMALPLFRKLSEQQLQREQEDFLSIQKVWLGFEDGYLAASNGGSYVMLFKLNSEEEKENVKFVPIQLQLEVSSTTPQSPSTPSPGMPPHHELPSISASSPSPKESRPLWTFIQSDQIAPAGFQMTLCCSTHLAEESQQEFPLSVTCLEFSSTLEILLVGTSKGLVVIDVKLGMVIKTITSVHQLESMSMPQGRTRRGSAAAFLHQSAKHVRQKDAPFQRQQTVVEIDSRSSRRHAHDQGNAEGYFVTTVKMSEMAVEKSYSQPLPVIWVGTSCGKVFGIVAVELSGKMSNRKVDLTPTGTVFDMKAGIVAIFTVTSEGHKIPPPCLHWKQDKLTEHSPTPYRQGSLTRTPKDIKLNVRPVSYLVIVSESRIKMYEAQKSKSVCKLQLINGAADVIIKAHFCWIRESPCCICLDTSGKISIVTLKGLHVVKEIDSHDLLQFSTLYDISEVGRIFLFANNGELQVVSLYKHDWERYPKQLPSMFKEAVAPAMKGQNSVTGGLISSMFSKPSALDKEQLFGQSGHAPLVAKTLSSPLAAHQRELGNQEPLRTKSEAVGGSGFTAVDKAVLAAKERGEKLNKIEEATVQMKTEASEFEELAKRLKNKYK